MSKMNPEWKTKWLEALRSGEYEQGREALRTHDNKFCCLGVLTDLVIKDGVGEWEAPEDESSAFSAKGSGETNWDYLPHWAVALTGVSGTGLFSAFSNSLSEMNDSGATFSQIANTIEESL